MRPLRPNPPNPPNPVQLGGVAGAGEGPGIVNVAPWQASSEAFDMLAEPLRVVCRVPLVEPTCGRDVKRQPGLVGVRDAPVGEQPAWPESGAMSAFVPFSDTAVTRTG